MGIICFSLFVLTFAAVVESQGVRRCNRNGKYYNPGQSWVNSGCTWKCNCYQGGSYKCSSLCYGLYTVRCRHDETKKYRKAPVPGYPQCQCDKPYCVKKPKKRDVCYDNGKRYNVGQSYIDAACKWRCQCKKGGRVSCQSVCLTYSLRCGRNKIKKITKIPVPGSSCQCDKPVCVNKPKVRCYYYGKYYDVGKSWVDSTCQWRCNCDSTGSYKCASLCSSSYYSLTCASNKIKTNKQIPVPGSSCKCNKQVCVDDPSRVCRYNGRRYSIDQSFVNDACTGQCRCKYGGRVSCSSLCPPRYLRCGPNQTKKVKRVAVPGSHCHCNKDVCVDKPKVQCNYKGKYYDAGKSWIVPCTWQCNCDHTGTYKCTSLCPSYSLTCRSNKIKINKKTPVPGSSCQCVKPVCVDAPSSMCYYGGKTYTVGQTFVDAACTSRCKCHKGGRVGSCVSLCPPYHARCGPNQTKKVTRVSVAGSHCRCKKEVCVDKLHNSIFCNFRGNLYPAGKPFVDPSCRWSCKCDARGIYNCKSACVYMTKRCSPWQTKRIKYVPVKNSKTCRCEIPYCE